MCGFAGVINLDGLQGDPAQRLVHLRAMGQQLARRGPDDEQFYDDGFLSLVFRRLAIIDLDSGRQPIWNEDHSVFVAVNGEIYNHRDIRNRLNARHTFSTRSDSEVIVHLYEERGAALMEELNGMFAFLVWDRRNRCLLLARDRLGIKPLFYTVTGNCLIFASELKALLAHPACPRELDWQSLDPGHGGMHNLQTYIKGIEHLRGGQYILLERGKALTPRIYWSISDHFPAAQGAGTRSAEDYLAHYGELLHDSVRKQLMSDVPVGLFLSGGIDSTLLAALAADAQQELHCFTVVEDSTIEAGDVEQARRACSELGLHYHPVRFDAHTVLDELDYDLAQFEFLIWAVETPRFSLEWMLKHELHRYAKTRVPELKVILLGQGADEFAGGYSQSMGRESHSWQAYTRRIAGLHEQLRRAGAGIPEHMHPALAPGYPPDRETPGLSEYHRHMVMRMSLLQSYNLWHEDRTSACQGVEARVPFLDHRLVELLASVPAALHESLFFNKRIVRAQLERSLPSYPKDKLKVRFTSTGKGESINRLRTHMIRRTFPEFRSKYLDQPGAIFSAQSLDACYRQITSSAGGSEEDMMELCECMAITVFDDLCKTIPTTGAPPAVNPPSPLRAWN